MKKFIIIALSAIMGLSACVKVDDIAAVKGIKGEVVFNTKNKVATKAIVEGTSMVDNFGVYGYVVSGTYSTVGGYLMKNAEYEETGNAANGAHYYWPKSDNNEGIDFIFTAYSQFDSNVDWVNDTVKITIPKLTQTLIDDPDDFDDVLWAQSAYNHHQNGNVGAEHERVNLSFKHTLSWLQFRGEVKNTNVKWVKVKQISFGEYVPGTPAIAGTPEVPYQPAVYDTTDIWVNLKRSYSAVASSTKLKGPSETTYTNAAALPQALVDTIKSYYSINNGTPGDYDLHMGNSVWPSNEIKQLRVVKAIPDEYKVSFDMHNTGEVMDFFNGWKYLQDNGYDIQPGTTGGKPAVWGYVLIDAFVNGAAYTVVGLNCGDLNAVPNYTIEEVSPEIPYQPGTPDIPATEPSSTDGLYIDGVIALPTASLISETPAAKYGTQKDTTLNYVSAQVDTLFTNDNEILGNALVIPQAVPEKITIVFDICIANPSGDDVVFTDRKITRVINTGKDADQDVDYTASWLASNKYIYNFRFDGDVLDFTVSVAGWSLGNNEYHVWDY